MQHEDWWYPWSPVKFRKDTMHLTPEQDGIYRRLLDHYMETGGPLPDNDAALARIAGCHGDSWGMAGAIVRAFFTPENGFLRHKKCEEVLAEQDASMKKASKKGKKGAAARWGNRTDKEREKCTSHAAGNGPANAQAMPNDATRQDKTGEESRGESITLPPETHSSTTTNESVTSLDDDHRRIVAYGVSLFPKLEGKNTGIIRSWLESGVVVKDVCFELEKARGKLPETWNYFDAAVRKAIEQRRTAQTAQPSSPSPLEYRAWFTSLNSTEMHEHLKRQKEIGREKAIEEARPKWDKPKSTGEA